MSVYFMCYITVQGCEDVSVFHVLYDYAGM